jgi:NAD(P)-dependent dehydrogenase (short-subunit alcohol dehydrogenase family)
MEHLDSVAHKMAVPRFQLKVQSNDDQFFGENCHGLIVTERILDGQVAVVVGGGGGIGSAIALEFSQLGASIVIVDPGVGVQGELLHEATAHETADRITARGGEATASTVSVSDRDALDSLFHEILREHGSLDIVIHAAGILRFAGLTESSEDDWTSVFDAHFEGFLNLLSCTLPRMASAKRGRILALTSGSGLARTSPGNGSYGVAKRAIAALTWELGQVLPDHLRVNSLSPIADTRMVRAAIQASHDGPREVNPHAVDLSKMPLSRDMARAAIFLVRDEAKWSQGQVLFSTGSEHSVVAPPRLLEVVPSEAVDFARALATLVPEVFVPAEQSQRTGGGSNSRFGEIFSKCAGPETPTMRATCVVISDDDTITASVTAAFLEWGVTAHVIGPATATSLSKFDFVDRTLHDFVSEKGHIDSIVIVNGAPSRMASSESEHWTQVVDSHSRVREIVMFNAAWLRGAARLVHVADLPARTIHLTPALNSSGRTAAQAVTQMVRNANDISTLTLDSFSVSLETLDPRDMPAISSLVARLALAEDVLALRGAELVAGREWIGIRSHPSPLITVSTDRTEIPMWANDVFQQRLTSPAV